MSKAMTSISTYVAPVRLDTSSMPILDVSTLPSSILMQTLGKALTLKRGADSATEAQFVAWLCNRLPVTMIDGAGNIHVDTRTSPNHRTMMTAHTDTVHHGGGVNTVRVDGDFWRADAGSALGADDGAGVAILCHMIQAGVPGLYVFFRGEECGGIGSRWLAANMPEALADIDRAVAFDRADFADVITHQAGGRCCSDEFAAELAAKLTTDVDWFLPDATGVYTDTAEFTGLVAECTNCSVGYKNQHGDREQLCIPFLQRLAQSVLTFDWDALPVKRDPKAREAFRYGGYADLGKYPAAISTAWDTPDGDLDYGLVPDEDEQEVMEAIQAACEDEDLGWLMDLMAEAVYPDDVGLALRMIDKRKLTELLADGYEMLEQGWAAHQVLEQLFEGSTQ